MAEAGAVLAGKAITCADLPACDVPLPVPESPLRVVVTGASSQLGHALLPMLRAQGHRVVALSRAANTSDATNAEWLRVDLREGWPDLGVFDALVSFGPLQALANALSALAIAPCRRLVATSSMSAESKRDAAVAEDRALSAALRQAEAALIAQCERLGIGWTILRPTMIYGLGLDANLSPIARRAIRTRLFPYPLGRGLRQPVHAEDVALAAWRAVTRQEAQGQVIEIGGGERLRIDAMFRRVRAGLPAWTMPLPMPRSWLRLLAALWPPLRGALSRIDDDLLADNRRLEALLGVQPRGFAPDVARWLKVQQ